MAIYIRPGVKTTDTIDKVLEAIEPCTRGQGSGVKGQESEIILDITSGLRDPADQLLIIAKFALANGVKFVEFDAKDVHGYMDQGNRVAVPFENHAITDGSVHKIYTWQRTWSRLLNLGIIINPPLAALCLEDYQHPTKGLVKAGTLVQGSPHYGGKAFDISGRPGIDRIVGILATAKLAGVGIKGWLVERNNNAVHVDCV